MRALPLAALILALAAPAATSTPLSGKRADCRPAGSRTLVANRQARVYVRRRDGEIFACSYRYGRRVRLSGPEVESVNAPLVANRRWVAFAQTAYCEGAAGCSYDVVERSLRTGRQRFAETNGGDETCVDPLDSDCGVSAVGRLLLRRDGATAWVACSGASDETFSECDEPPYWLQVRDHRGARVLDKGRIRIRSLRFAHNRRRITWEKRGRHRSARLY